MTCQHCGTVFKVKTSGAVDRLFCSRRCMQHAWRCGWCAKLVPAARRDSSPYCSDRCQLSADLEAEALAAGVRRSFCPVCAKVKPEDEFHREKGNRNGLSVSCKTCTRIKYEENKDAYRLRRYKYKSAEDGQVIPFTSEEKAARFSMWGGRCWRCGIADATEEDHVKPLAKGGFHCLSNLRPVCQKCNATKRDLWPLPSGWRRAGFRQPNPAPGSDRERRRPREPHMEHTCPHCERVAMVPAHWARTRIYCSRECANAAKVRPPIVLICAGCCCEVTLPGHEANKTRKFCSKACANPSRGNRRGRHTGRQDVGQLALFG